jgi:hypothetical protein
MLGIPLQQMFHYLGKVKRMYAMLILAILLMNTAGFYVYYAVQLQQIRYEMRQVLKLLPDHALEVLTLSHAAYNAAKVEEHEVRVQGKMYDIARIAVSGDSVKVFCIHDAKEDNLVIFLAEIVSKPLKDRSSMPGTILEFLSLIFLPPANEWYFHTVSPEKIFPSYHFSIRDVLIFRDSPPPWKTA